MERVKAPGGRSFTRRQVIRAGVAIGAVSVLGPLAVVVKRRWRARPNILLITLDTTRADRLGCYGYHRPTSPRLDALANEAIVYTEAIAPATWTLPSHASLFTGKFPSSHGARYDPTGNLDLTKAIAGGTDWDRYRVRGLASTEATLAGLLARAGYKTGGIVGGPWLKRVFGLDNGFAFYDDDGITRLNGRVASDVTTRAVRWLEGVEASQPFFLFLNYFDAHTPYSPPAEFARRFLRQSLFAGERPSPEQKRDLYDGEISYMDHSLGDLFAAMQRLKLYDNTWIIITADHGELLGEHETFGHGDAPYQELLHIPFVSKQVRGEDAPGRTDARVQLPDIFSLILSRLGLPIPDGTQGSLPHEPTHPIIAESDTLPSVGKNGNWRAILSGKWKFIWNSLERHAFYDLGEDPAETRNLFTQYPDQALGMERTMKEFLASLPPPPAQQSGGTVDEATRERLRSLGYLQ